MPGAFRSGLLAAGLAVVLSCAAQAQTADPKAPENDDKPAAQAQKAAASTPAADAICLLIEAAAGSHRSPVPFFTRLIGQESSFRTNVEGPVTRSGDRAQGIAQFMPKTAAERGLLDPFDPVQALPRSAEFLRELKDRFGNWGLAAAAYNAGPQRVRDWLAGKGGMPAQTRAYVLAITGHPIEDWAGATKDIKNEKAPGCRDL